MIIHTFTGYMLDYSNILFMLIEQPIKYSELETLLVFIQSFSSIIKSLFNSKANI